jgi:lipoprotein-anchoring transpeptidase ErfK/SrfK
MGTQAAAGARRTSRVLVASALALLLLEALAIGIEAVRAEATVLREPVLAASAPTGRARADIRVPPWASVPPQPIEDAAGERSLLVEVDRALAIRTRPGTGRSMGVMPAGSRFYGVPTVAWVHRVTPDGRFGLVDVPYVARRATGWIPLRGLDRSWTRIHVEADLSEHRITVWRGDAILFRAPAATGAPASPTPAGRYFVTDRIPFAAGSSLGTFAFGISGIQPNLPAGWTGGDQLAIHGTNAPSTIGMSASAGCLRVSERILDRLRPLLRLGTPVVVHS